MIRALSIFAVAVVAVACTAVYVLSSGSSEQDRFCAMVQDHVLHHNSRIAEFASALDLTKFRCDSIGRTDANHVVVRWSLATKPGSSVNFFFGPVLPGDSYLVRTLDGDWDEVDHQ